MVAAMSSLTLQPRMVMSSSSLLAVLLKRVSSTRLSTSDSGSDCHIRRAFPAPMIQWTMMARLWQRSSL